MLSQLREKEKMMEIVSNSLSKIYHNPSSQLYALAADSCKFDMHNTAMAIC